MTVEEIFSRIIGRVQHPSCSIIEAAQVMQEIVVNLLFVRRSDVLMAEAPVRLRFLAGQQHKILPEEVIGVAGRPVLASGLRLRLLAGREDPVTDPGEPTHYRVLGRQLRIYPQPVADVDVTIPVYERPERLQELTDELPFYGLFDAVFADGCVTVLQVGSAAMADKAFVGMLGSQIDAVLQAREMGAEQLMADTINQEAAQWG